jgi:solute carrier family 25 carnitine/acylcarnitine transporter 20/29
MQDQQSNPMILNKKMFKTYAFAYIYNNFTIIFGHPAERLKVATQIDLKKPQLEIVCSLLKGNYGNLYRGLSSCILRQNTKIFHRTLIMSTLPKWVDGYQFNIVTSSFLKGLGASCIDTILSTPFETIKLGS